MPRKKSENKKEKEPLVIHTPSGSFYKAFMFPTDPPEMQVDISGDTFSHTPEQAVRACLMHLTKDELVSIPFMILNMMETNNIVEIPEDKVNERMKQLVLIRLIANNVEDFEKASTECDPGLVDEKATAEYESISEDEFWLQVKALKEGYSMGVQDYTVKYLETKTKSAMDPEIQIIRGEFEVSEPETANSAFPKTIVIEG